MDTTIDWGKCIMAARVVVADIGKEGPAGFGLWQRGAACMGVPVAQEDGPTFGVTGNLTNYQ